MSRKMLPCEEEPEMWHVDAVDSEDTALAKHRCLTECPVKARTACFILGDGEKHGVWGGTDVRERGRVKYRRELALLKAGTAA